MGAILYHQSIHVPALEPYSGAPLPAIEDALSGSPPVMAFALNAAGDLAVRARLGAVPHELIGTALLIVRAALFSPYTSGPVRLGVKLDAKGATASGVADAWGVETLGPEANFPGVAARLFNYEISVPAGDARDNVAPLDAVDLWVALKPDAARTGVSDMVYLRELSARLELPEA